jgi:maltose alpha-D-glucosyltransferase / alpha-amylase
MSDSTHPLDPSWYKDAVVYQLHVRTFFDANDDGIGDFAGLAGKLDYLQALGVNTLWLLPFYPSPLRDDGYDVAHYQGVHPAYGTLRDVRRLFREAHARGLRVITELVMNHTSDQHPWFQAARHSPAGSPARDFYVWSESDRKYEGVRIIFTDTETSNWTWDPVAGQYYWHRFFHHQPDLNFDNPRVLRALLRVMRFWLELGVDAFRLDAIPYLVEREGTSCESLPETHAVIRQVRRFIDTEFPGRVLLAEANQWPSDVSAYFGHGDECHLAFHFPLMPRLFMAMQREDREPVVEILRQTPTIPPSCQWALFLRNHDELTLEMVTPEEREYMYAAFATDPRMRINVGIRRRLAPLMHNDRRRIELMNVLLLSLPGTPVIYYGDEIGMGDNIYLSDRHGVRTPMQWTGDRNGGFSRADPQRLCAPPVMDPLYGFQAVNVEAQERSPASLLNWMRRMVALRSEHRTFGRGSIEFVDADNRRVLAYLRRHDDEVVLVVANLAGSVQTAQLALGAEAGRVPIEMLGRTRLPLLDTRALFLTLAPYGWYWFLLARADDERVSEVTAPEMRKHPLPDLLVNDRWDELFEGPGRGVLEARYVLPYLLRQSWFRMPGVAVRATTFAHWAVLRRGSEPIVLAAVDVEGDLATTRYGLVLGFAAGPRADELLERHPDRVLARIAGARHGIIHEVIESDAARVLVRTMAESASVHGRDGIFDAASAGPAVLADDEPYALVPTPLAQTVIQCGAAAELKIRRRLLRGPSGEHALLALLGHDIEHAMPVVLGSLDLRTPDGERWPFILLRSPTPFDEDGWSRATGQAARWLADPRAVATGDDPLRWLRDRAEVPQPDSERLLEAMASMHALGQHLALAHIAFAEAGPAADLLRADPLARQREQQIVQTALATVDEVDADVRSRWTSLLASPAAERVLDSRRLLGALARWRWQHDRPIAVDVDDATAGTIGAVADYGERDIASLAADLAYAAYAADTAVAGADPARRHAQTWWQYATAALVKGWVEAIGSRQLASPPTDDVVRGLRAGLIAHLLVDALSASTARRTVARDMLALMGRMAKGKGDPPAR